MTNSEVEAVLKFYKWIDLDIKIMNEWLKQYEDGYNPLGAVKYDGMPHGSKQGDNTAVIAMGLAEEDTKENIEILKMRIKELREIRTQIFKEISSLMTIHKVIIYNLYLRGQKWNLVAKRIGYSVRQAKNIRCNALNILGEKLEENKYLSQSDIIKEILKYLK